MLFPTVQFAIFFTIVLGLSTLLRRYFGPWRVFMVAASFFFYCYWDPRFGFLLAASVAWNFIFGRLIAARLPVDVAVLAGHGAVEAGGDFDVPPLALDGPFLAEVEISPRGS